MIEQTEEFIRTKFGLIPRDWGLIKLKDIGSSFIGLTYSPEDVVDNKMGTLVLRSSNIQDGKLSFQDNVFVNKEIKEKLFVKKGDLLVCARNGSKKLIGKNALIDKDYNYSFGAFMSVFRSEFNEYIYQLFQTNMYKKQVQVNLGATINQITTKDINAFQFPFPKSKKEQQKIVSILSTWDKAIELKEKLIAQKKEQKKGLMQKLITGQIRLEGFKDEWKEIRLDKIAKVSIGLVTTMTTNYVENGVPLIRNSDISPNKISTKLIQLDKGFAEKHKGRMLKTGDIVTVHTGDVGISAVIEKEMDGCLGFATLNTRIIDNLYDPYFISYYFNSKKFINFALKMSTGDGRNNFNLKDFKNTIVPKISLEEQKAIVNVLTLFDKEIYLLEHELNELKLQKKALMQQLLTGKIRVKV